MRTFAERPRTSRLHKNLTKKEISHWAVEERDDRSALRPHKPFLRNYRTRFARVPNHMSVCMPWNSAADLTEDRSGIRKIGRDRNLNLETIEDFGAIHDRKAAAKMDNISFQRYLKVRIFCGDLLFYSSK